MRGQLVRQALSAWAACSPSVEGLFAKRQFCEQGSLSVPRGTKDPILVCYSLDSTPLSARERYAKRDGDVAVVRFGKQCSDWVMHRVFLQDVQGRTTVVFSDPVRLATRRHGAIGALIDNCCRCLMSELSHKGLCTTMCSIVRFGQRSQGTCERRIAWWTSSYGSQSRRQSVS